MNTLWMLVKTWVRTSNNKQKWTCILIVVGLLCTGVLFSLNGGAGTARDPLGSTPLYFVGAFVKLLVVLLLIVLSAIFARRWLQPGRHGKRTRQIQLMESVRLSPKQALHLVSIGDQHFLIGATDQNLSLISPVEVSPPPIAVGEASPQTSLDFGSLLQSFNTNMPGNPSE
jgi:flagellar biosynthetic protein FliO